MAFQHNLRHLKESAGLDEGTLARRVGCSEEELRRWESGESTPSLEALSALADALHTTTDTLLSHHAEPEGNALYTEGAVHETVSLKGLKVTGKSHSKQDTYLMERFASADLLQPLDRMPRVGGAGLQNALAVRGTLSFDELLHGEIHKYYLETDGKQILVEFRKTSLTLTPIRITYTGRPFALGNYLYARKNYRLLP